MRFLIDNEDAVEAGQAVLLDRDRLSLTLFDKLLVANRGEIAVRIIRAAKELGIRTVQVYSEADGDMLAVRLPTRRSTSGRRRRRRAISTSTRSSPRPSETGADAIHPGYGFLSENADFAEAVARPAWSSSARAPKRSALMGDKAAARAAAQAAGVPIVPGSDGRVADRRRRAGARRRRSAIRCMIKAAAGGGGRGIRIAANDGGARRGSSAAQAEAQAAFGDGGLYLERFIKRARHVEVQVLGDGERVVHCFERECSLQRRRQKVWEEAPSPAIWTRRPRQRCALPRCALPSGRLPRRRHARISLRRRRRRILSSSR